MDSDLNFSVKCIDMLVSPSVPGLPKYKQFGNRCAMPSFGLVYRLSKSFTLKSVGPTMFHPWVCMFSLIKNQDDVLGFYTSFRRFTASAIVNSTVSFRTIRKEEWSCDSTSVRPWLHHSSQKLSSSAAPTSATIGSITEAGVRFLVGQDMKGGMGGEVLLQKKVLP